MNDDLEVASVAAAASSTEGEPQTSFRKEIERLFAEYTASLRKVLGSPEITEQPEKDSIRSRKSPKEKHTEGR